MPRGRLFDVLISELGVDLSTVKCLFRMYTDIRAAVCIGQHFSLSFAVNDGVRQGCPASPLVFSLFMDRLERFLLHGVVAALSPA